MVADCSSHQWDEAQPEVSWNEKQVELEYVCIFEEPILLSNT